jgi:hypothetical protein
VYEYVAKEPIKRMLRQNKGAESFYLAHEYGDNKRIPIKRVRQYTRAAIWLTMLTEISAEISLIKKKLCITIPVFYKHVADLMEVEKQRGKLDNYEGDEQLPGDFPTSYGRLLQKQAAFKAEGFSSLIDKMYGNQLAAKIKDGIAEDYLLSLIEDEKQYDDVLVCMMYNVWAKQHDYALITPATVGVWRRKKQSSIMIGRHGNSAMNEKYIRQVKGVRPSAPLFLLEHDDNNLDFLFNDTAGYQYNKYVAIVVTDSCCDLVLGKSYLMAQSPVAAMVHHAYLDAMYYIRSLTGGWYLPFEVKGDRWQSKALVPFYESMAKNILPAKGNKHRGYIEPFFGSPLWKRSQKLVSEGNYSGNNITARNRGVNVDAMDRLIREKSGPHIGNEAEVMIENMFTLLRTMPDIKRDEMDAPSKEQQWLQMWEQMPVQKRRPITDEQFLLIFGIKHQPAGKINANTITNRGVEPQIGNVKYSFDLPEAWMYNELIGEQVTVVYDPFDMSRVLVTNGENIRFIAQTAQLTPRAIEDSHTGSRQYLNAVLQEKKQQVVTAGEGMARRRATVQPSFNAEAVLQGGVLIKEIKNKALAIADSKFTEERQAFLEEDIDINEFL